MQKNIHCEMFLEPSSEITQVFPNGKYYVLNKRLIDTIESCAAIKNVAVEVDSWT